MSVRKLRISVVAVVTGLLLVGCGGTSDRSVVRTTTIEPSPDTTTSEPSPSSAGSGDTAWFASANEACQQAIVEYQQVKAAVQSQNPEALQYSAAAAASDVVDAVDSLPVPPSARAKSFKASVHKYAAPHLEMATAMSGTLADINKASIHYDAAVKPLVAVARDAGADSCVAMTHEF
jgi:hypothetical protein